MKSDPRRRLRLASAGTVAVVVLLGAAAIVTGSALFAGAALVAVVVGCAVIAACVPSKAQAVPAGANGRVPERAPRIRAGLSMVDIVMGMVVMAILASIALYFAQLGAR